MTGYGLGSYVYADGTIHFTAFIPNALHKPGLLANLYFSCAARAQAMESRFAEGTGTRRLLPGSRRPRPPPPAAAGDRTGRRAPHAGCPMARAQSGGG